MSALRRSLSRHGRMPAGVNALIMSDAPVSREIYEARMSAAISGLMQAFHVLDM